MKSPKFSHTGDPLTVVLISYLGRDICLLKTPGNLNGTYNTPKPYSRSTNNGGTSKRTELHGANLWVLELPLFVFPKDRVVQTFVFSSCPSCVITCHPRHQTPLLLAQDLSTVNGLTMSSLPLSPTDSTTVKDASLSQRTPFFLLLGRAMLTKRPTSSQ